MFFCPLQRVLKPKPNAKMQLISQTLHHKLKKSYFLYKKKEITVTGPPIIVCQTNYLEDSTDTFLKSFINFIRFKAALRARAPAALFPFST